MAYEPTPEQLAKWRDSLPELFFTHPSHSRMRYTKEYTGELALERLDKDDRYIETANVTEDAPRILVIYHVGVYKGAEREVVQAYIAFLLAEGFTVYVADSVLRPIHHPDNLTYSCGEPREEEDIITHVLPVLGVSRDQVHLLEERDLQKLAAPELADDYLVDLARIDSSHYQKWLIYWQKKGLPISFKVSSLSAETINKLAYYRRFFEHAKIVYDLKSIYFHRSFIDELHDALMTDEITYFGDFEFKKTLLESVESIDLDSIRAQQFDLTNVLSLTPRLKKLTLRKTPQKSQFFLSKPMVCASVTSLSLDLDALSFIAHAGEDINDPDITHEMFMDHEVIDVTQSNDGIDILLSCFPSLTDLAINFLNPQRANILKKNQLKTLSTKKTHAQVLKSLDMSQLTKLDIGELILENVTLADFWDDIVHRATELKSITLSKPSYDVTIEKQVEALRARGVEVYWRDYIRPDFRKVIDASTKSPNPPSIDLKNLPKHQQDESLPELPYFRRPEIFQSAPAVAPSTTVPEGAQVKLERKPDATTRKPIDMQTEKPGGTLKTTRTFFPLHDGDPLHPADYRVDVYDQVMVNPSAATIENAVYLDKPMTLNMEIDDVAECLPMDVMDIAEDLPRDEAKTLYYAKHPIHLSSTPVPLGSPGIGAKISHYHVNYNVPIRLFYSKVDDLYYVALANEKSHPIDTTIDFFVDKPTLPAQAQIPKDIQAIIDKYRNRTKIEKLKVKEGATGRDYLAALQKQSTGACRHRTVALMAELLNFKATMPGFDMRAIGNPIHMYLEIRLEENGPWLKVDAGGYDADLEIDDRYNPTRKIVRHPPLPIEVPESAPQIAAEFEPIPSVAEIYCEDFLSSDTQTACLSAPDKTSAQSALIALTAQLHQQGYAVYHVNSADDLTESNHWIKREGGIGHFEEGIGGPLHDFLDTKNPKPRIMLVDYTQFTAEEMVLMGQPLQSDKPMLGNNALLEAVKVIGVTYKDHTAHTQLLDAPNNTPLQNEAAWLHESSQWVVNPLRYKDGVDGVMVPLYNMLDWKARLLGREVFQDGQLVFQPGLLAEALAANKPLIIGHGLWKDPAFIAFWAQARIEGVIHHLGHEIAFPPETVIYRQDTYDWPRLRKVIEWSSHVEKPVNLNPNQLNAFFWTRYTPDANGNLQRAKGYLSQPGKKEVYLTRNLSDDQWAILLDECEKNKVQLVISASPDVVIPAFLAPPPLSSAKEKLPNVTLYRCSDIEAAASLLHAEDETYTIIDVSGLGPGDLIERLTNTFDKSQKRYVFKTEPGVLQDMPRVILKGDFSDRLVDDLQAWFKNNPQNQYICVTDKTTAWPYLAESTTIYTSDIKDEDAEVKQKALLAEGFTETNLFAGEPIDWSLPLNSLRALLNHRLVGNLPGGPWVGFDKAPPVPPFEPNALTGNTAQKTSRYFADFVDNMMLRLQHPRLKHIYLTGLTGVGKTTTVKKKLATHPKVRIFEGEDQMATWGATVPQPGEIILLFLDEINLSDKDFRFLQGMYHAEPSIIYKNKVIKLTPQHRLIVAGNPTKQYASERVNDPFFSAHGNAYLMNPLPLFVIYEEIIKPVFAGLGLQEGEIKAISGPILTVYQYVCQHSAGEVRMSPRELQMMALLTLQYCKNNKKASWAHTAQYYAYHIAEGILNEKELAELKALPGLQIHDDRSIKRKNMPNIFPSRQAAAHLLHDTLALRDWRMKHNAELTPVQRQGGLGGIVLEGKADSGRHRLVKQALKGREKEVCHIPANVILSKKKALIRQAILDKKIIYMEGFNSSPMLERWLNALLMGQHPETNQPLPTGVFVIATQLPVTELGTKITSPALQRRMIQCQLPPFTETEQTHIRLEKFRHTLLQEPNKEVRVNGLRIHHLMTAALKQGEDINPALIAAENALQHRTEATLDIVAIEVTKLTKHKRVSMQRLGVGLFFFCIALASASAVCFVVPIALPAIILVVAAGVSLLASAGFFMKDRSIKAEPDNFVKSIRNTRGG